MDSSSISSHEASSQSQASVLCPHCGGSYTRRGLTRHIRAAHNNDDQDSGTNDGNAEIPTYINDLFTRAFGAPLVNEAGIGMDLEWTDRWQQAMKLKGKQYHLPQGAVGRRFVDLLTKEIQNIANNSRTGLFEKVFFMCSTILQKEKRVKQGTDIRRLLGKRMDMWVQGQYDELLMEAKRISRQFKSSQMDLDENHKVRIFTRLVCQGKLRDATRWITDRSGGKVMQANTILPNGKTVFEVLQDKHPTQKYPALESFTNCHDLPLMIDVDVTSSHIEDVARRIRGSAGPSGTDAEQWQSFLLRFGAHSARLRESVASLTRYIANNVVEWNILRPFLARRGVALDKCPGVRPIGVGELLQRICAKSMAIVTGPDATEACGADQLCAGTKGGIEGAIHTMSALFDEGDQQGLLLVDAANAFNALNRPMALWHARVFWPRCARFLFNTYRGYPLILLTDEKHILSQEGTTQGDPLAMIMYAIGVLPLIKRLKSRRWIQNWYADDSACYGSMEAIAEWMELLLEEGPKFGYYPEPNKSVLVVKRGMETRNNLEYFKRQNVKICYSSRFLGGFVGDSVDRDEYVKTKVAEWVQCVSKFATASSKSPQAAYAAYVRSLQCEWEFLQRVTKGSNDSYLSLSVEINTAFIPNLLGREITDLERRLFCLPARLGGVDVKDPSASAFSTSESAESSAILMHAIRSGDPLNTAEHIENVRRVRKQGRSVRDNDQKAQFEQLVDLLPAKQSRSIKRIVEAKSSQWLTVSPTMADNFDLSATQFRDALALRYGRDPSGLPSHCDGCEEQMSLTHALNCKKGGLVKHGHDNHRDDCAKLASLAWGSVGVEPILREAENERPALIADIVVEGLWEGGRKAFLDNRIVNADAPSYLHQDWDTTARAHSQQKHAKYDVAAEDRRGSFTPLICSCDGALHVEYSAFLKRLADRLSEKWAKPYSQVLNWVRVKIQFSIIRAVSLRLRGSRRKLRHLNLEDGAAVPAIS